MKTKDGRSIRFCLALASCALFVVSVGCASETQTPEQSPDELGAASGLSGSLLFATNVSHDLNASTDNGQNIWVRPGDTISVTMQNLVSTHSSANWIVAENGTFVVPQQVDVSVTRKTNSPWWSGASRTRFTWIVPADASGQMAAVKLTLTPGRSLTPPSSFSFSTFVER